MSVISLSDCLAKNQATLGSNFSNLGRTISSWRGHKILLSYTKKNGWGIRKLNIVQFFLRKVFGAYRSTHLSLVCKKINQLEISDNIKNCHRHIQLAWMKKHLIGLGNANLADARVICFAEKHGNSSFRAGVAYLINSHYRDGDIILGEGLEVGKTRETRKHQQVGNVRPGLIVHGWEPKNFQEMQNNWSPFKKADQMHGEIKKQFDLFEYLKEKDIYTSKETEDLKLKIDRLINKIEELNKYYKSKSPRVLRVREALEGIFEKFKNKTLDKDGKHGVMLYYCIILMLEDLEKEQEKALYRKITFAEARKIIENCSERNSSLSREIHQQRKQGRRIFVPGGATHFLEGFGDDSCKKVKNTLKQDKFITIVAKKDLTFWRSFRNRDLKTQAFLP